MDSFQERLSNRYWWALPDYFPDDERARVAQNDMPPWIRVYRPRPGYYAMRIKHQGPSGYYTDIMMLCVALTVAALIYLLAHTLFAVAFFAILSAPLWPLITDIPLDKLELVIRPDGNIYERTMAGHMIPLANFNEGYNWRAQTHSEQFAAQSRNQFFGSVMRAIQQFGMATAGLGRRQPGLATTAAGALQPGVSAYQNATELFLIRGAGGAVAVKIAEFMDDFGGHKATALQKSVDEVVRRVKADIAGQPDNPSAKSPETPRPEPERYE